MRDQKARREAMVGEQISRRGVRDPLVLEAMRTVPREEFVPIALRDDAYADEPLPIEERQTISQPYIVAAMIEAARPQRTDRALEIGTGSGYSAAVLATIIREVYTVERLAGLADSAGHRLARLGYTNVHVRHANGTLGWPERAPYDIIIVTAGGPRVPPPLLDQLAVEGRLVMPVGTRRIGQRLVRITCTGRPGDERYAREELEAVAFVPLIGAEGWPAESASITPSN